MGTNFYLMTKSKEKRDRWFEWSEYSLTDTPDWGYEVHIAKTSAGWRPLFEAHERIRSVHTLKRIYEDGGFQIFDEYGTEYDWPGFEERVLNFGKGNADALSHLDGKNVNYSREYYADEDGYEFTKGEFC